MEKSAEETKDRKKLNNTNNLGGKDISFHDMDFHLMSGFSI